MRLLTFVHGLLALAMPWLLMVLFGGVFMGCQLKSIEPEPAVSFQAENKDQAVNEAHEGKTLFDIKANEGVATNITQSVVGGTPRVILQRDILISEKRIDGDDMYLKIVTKTVDFTQDPPEENLVSDEASIPVNLSKLPVCGAGRSTVASSAKPPSFPILEAHLKAHLTGHFKSNSGSTTGFTAHSSALDAIRELGKISIALAEAESVLPCEMCSAGRVLDSSIRVDYSNLKITKSVGLPPAAVVSNSCRGISPCRIKYTKINYDEVYSTPTISRRRYNCELIISPSVPYLSAVLSSCRSFLVKIDDQDLPVQACVQVADWQPGT